MNIHDSLYKIDSHKDGIFEVTMLEGHPVYEGHFPGQPITPGVLTLAMVRECASMQCGKVLKYAAIKNCRLTAMIRPGERLQIKISMTPAEGCFLLTVSIADLENVEKLQLDATLVVE